MLDEIEVACNAGWWGIGFVSYEAAAGLDARLPVCEGAEGIPLVWFGVCRAPQIGTAIESPRAPRYTISGWRTQWSKSCYRRRVETVLRQIAAGETYQCNLTTRIVGEAFGELQHLYANLALAQRGSYNAYLDTGRFVIASASPELFYEVRNGRICMRPMKGTAPRGKDPAEDGKLASTLHASSKERAENIMIVDLVRNDIAQVAETGSVVVTDLCRVEQYETVHQLTSGISARLRSDAGLTDVFRALFPCGSVTGAPKRRTMQLIRSLEDSARGVYCGAVGMVAPKGAAFQARFNVAIRTATIFRETGVFTYGTGGGITWDSDPAAEYAELVVKAQLLRRCSAAAAQRGPGSSSAD